MQHNKFMIQALFISTGARVECSRTGQNRPTDLVNLEAALLLVYAGQTLDEQADESTYHANGLGFSGRDAVFCSSLAKQVLAGRFLSRKQNFYLAQILPRYWRQLGALIPEEAEAPLILDPYAGEVEPHWRCGGVIEWPAEWDEDRAKRA